MIRFAQRLSIEGTQVGKGCPVYLIAEAGVAHFGIVEKALRLVDLAVDAGADAVKFQVFDVDALISRALPAWRARLASRQLPYPAFERIQGYCRHRGITFFATAHDEPSLEFLASLDVPAYKVGSGEVGNWPFLEKVAALGKPVIFSTGMYQFDQVGEALEAMARTGNREIAALHCVTQYPTPPPEAALGNIAAIRERYNVITGYSDHTMGFHLPLAAAAVGAKIIEKHISLDFNMPNAQDWKVSCGPDDFPLFVRQAREIEAGLETRLSGPAEGEQESKKWAAKSIVTACNVAAGTCLRKEDLAIRRAGSGIPPARMGEVIGRRLIASLESGDLITWEKLA